MSSLPSAPQRPHEPEKIYRVLGFAFRSNVLYGIAVLFFALGYLGINADESRASSIYTTAKPASGAATSGVAYVTGIVDAAPIGSRFVKPGPYLKIEQTSEVYAWHEDPGRRGQSMYDLEWQAAPRDPKTFFYVEEKKKPLYKNALELASVVAKPARVVPAGGKPYAVDLDEIELPLDVVPVAPARDVVVTNGYDVVASGEDGSLALYQTEACRSQPQGGCQRVVLRVLPKPTGPMTFIGKAEGDRITKFEGSLKAGVGDFQQTLAEYKFAKTVSGMGIAIERFVIFLGVCLALGLLADPLRKTLRLGNASPVVIALGGAVVLGSAAFLLRQNALLVFVVALVPVLLGCRAPRNEAR